MKTALTIGLFSIVMAGCATAGPKGGMPKVITLEFKGRPGEISVTRYYSNARILSYESGQLIRDKLEGVDFSVNTHFTDVNPQSKILKYSTKTTRKDGIVDLHDLAFPELNEQIDYVIHNNGEVLQANHLPPQSLFYVPALPIPANPVEIGDTWTMEHTWYSAKDAIPLRLQVVGILKNIVVCEKKNLCADLEISGHVSLVAEPTALGASFASRVWGRVLFSLERGDVIWSEMRSSEDMGVKGDKISVRSCMVSEMKLADNYQIKFACDPHDDEVTKTPTY